MLLYKDIKNIYNMDIEWRWVMDSVNRGYQEFFPNYDKNVKELAKVKREVRDTTAKIKSLKVLQIGARITLSSELKQLKSRMKVLEAEVNYAKRYVDILKKELSSQSSDSDTEHS